MKKILITGNAGYIGSHRGSHAHLVKPLGAKTLIESSKKYGYLPLDMAISKIKSVFFRQKNKQFSHTKE